MEHRNRRPIRDRARRCAPDVTRGKYLCRCCSKAMQSRELFYLITCKLAQIPRICPGWFVWALTPEVRMSPPPVYYGTTCSMDDGLLSRARGGVGHKEVVFAPLIIGICSTQRFCRASFPCTNNIYVIEVKAIAQTASTSFKLFPIGMHSQARVGIQRGLEPAKLGKHMCACIRFAEPEPRYSLCFLLQMLVMTPSWDSQVAGAAVGPG